MLTKHFHTMFMTL